MKNKIFGLIVVLFLIIIGFIYLKPAKYLYHISYESYIGKYDIYIYNDNNVEVKTKENVICIQAPCLPVEYNHKIELSTDDMKIIYAFAEELFKEKNKKTLNVSLADLTEWQISFLNSLIFNDSTYLKDFADIFNPGSGSITNDKDFVENQVDITFFEGVSLDYIKKFVRGINGTIDAYEESSINSYAVTLNKEFASIEEIYGFCNSLLETTNIIEDCNANFVHYLDNN